jgi:hypothetical protein
MKKNKIFKRQKPVTAVLSEEKRKSLTAASLVKKESFKRRHSLVCPKDSDFDFSDPKTFEVILK